jgi:hypothetical protein
MARTLFRERLLSTFVVSPSAVGGGPRLHALERRDWCGSRGPGSAQQDGGGSAHDA